MKLLEASVSEFADLDEHHAHEHPEERFISGQKHTAKAAAVTNQRLLMHAARVAGGGPRAGTVAVFHDVSEIRRLEQVRTDFIANASHELRTPLTSIQGYADMLLAGPALDTATESALRVIDRNARRLNALVEDLLELSRIEGRRSPLRPGETDVRHICTQLGVAAVQLPLGLVFI